MKVACSFCKHKEMVLCRRPASEEDAPEHWSEILEDQDWLECPKCHMQVGVIRAGVVPEDPVPQSSDGID